MLSLNLILEASLSHLKLACLIYIDQFIFVITICWKKWKKLIILLLPAC